jgi:nucleoside-diphosphate-sugar epimerase
MGVEFESRFSTPTPLVTSMNCENITASQDRFLVTGSNGFIGTKVIETLLEYGHFNLRCFVRPSSTLENLKNVLGRHPAANRVEIVVGDLLSRDDCRKAADGISVIIHLAAGFDKSFARAFMNSAVTTRNLIEAFLELGRPKRFVNVSSFAVYSNLKMDRGALLDENCPLEDAPQNRHDAYGFGKLKQEEIVYEYGKTRGLPYVILRPGAVFGPGKPDLTGRIGMSMFGFFLHVGGSNQLPLTYVDNCAEAIVLAALKTGVDGDIFNVVDDDLLTSQQFLNAYRKRVGRFVCLPLPYFVAYSLCAICECFSKHFKRLPRSFNRRRCAAEWKGNRFSNQRLHDRLGWKPRVPMNQAMEEFLAQFGSKTS